MMVLTLVAHAEEITSVKVGLKVFFILDPDRRAPFRSQDVVSAIFESMWS